MKKGSSCKIDGFKYPAADNISGRTSTICRSMACTLLSRDPCSKEEELVWKKYFPDKKCAYCGRSASHLDHLYPLIEKRRPTGYCTEPANLVPCCTKCNQPKGNLNYEEYMRGGLCDHTLESGDTNIDQARERRIQNIKNFQKAMPPHIVNIDVETLQKWDDILKSFDNALVEAQSELLKLKEEIYK